MKQTFLTASALALTGIVALALTGFVATAAAQPAPSQCDAIAGNLVTNCGFETGDLTGWTQSGNTGHTGVAFDTPFFVHSGDYGLQEGPVGSDGFISQTLSTVPGAAYSITAWYNPSGSTPADFDIEWNGNTLLDVPDFPVTGWLPYTVFATGTGSDLLTISFRDDPSFSGIDDISVTSVTAAPEPGSLALLGAAFAGLGLLRRRSRKV